MRTFSRPWLGLGLVLGELALGGCMSPGVVTSASPDAPTSNANVASTSSSTGLSPAASLPLGQGSPAAGVGSSGATPSGTAASPTTSAGQQPAATPLNAAPNGSANANVVQSPNATGTLWPANNPNGTSATTPAADGVVLEGDVSRFKYAFFTKTSFNYGTRYVFPFFGVVFSADPNLCTRTAVPLHISEFTAYQLWPDTTVQTPADNLTLNFNALFNAATYYDLSSMRASSPDAQPPPGASDVGYQASCDVYSSPRGGRSFSQASWQLTPPAGKTLDDAETVTVALHARNSVQEIAWTLQAQRCPGVIDYFQDLGGNHFFPQMIACVNVAGVTPAATHDPNVAASPKNPNG